MFEAQFVKPKDLAEAFAGNFLGGESVFQFLMGNKAPFKEDISQTLGGRGGEGVRIHGHILSRCPDHLCVL